MIQLLYLVIFLEVVLILILLFKTPLRKLVIMALDRVKRGRGPVMVKSVMATVGAVLLSSLYNMMKIKNSNGDDGGVVVVNPTDQVLFVKHLLESTLIGGCIFLALMVDRLHHYIRELRIRRKTMEAAKKEARGFEDGKAGAPEEVKSLKEETSTLREKLKQLESELAAKTKEASAAEANAIALSKQSEGFLLEYDRILEENQNLRNRLHSLDRQVSHSSSKKYT